LNDTEKKCLTTTDGCRCCFNLYYFIFWCIEWVVVMDTMNWLMENSIVKKHMTVYISKIKQYIFFSFL
jgi:hypothetical protein